MRESHEICYMAELHALSCEISDYIYIYIYMGWVQVTSSLTLSNVTLLNIF